MSDRVLLTGISGFLGGHVALQLLNAGYTVRGSVRNLSKADKVRDTMRKAGADITKLEFVALDLMSDTGWTEAASGCRYVQHTASPFVLKIPADKMELIGPAVEGTERALNAANAAGAERIVLTSSMAAIAYVHDKTRSTPFTASDWTDLQGRGVNPYQESKTLAERRAWDIMDAAGRRDALAVINPGGIFGPLLDEDSVTAANPVMNMTRVSGAMTAPGAGGQRFPMGERTIFFCDAARILRERYPDHRVPRITMPDWAVRLYGLFDQDVRDNLGELGLAKQLDSSAVVALLGRRLTPIPESIVATADSLIAHRLV